MGEMAEARPLTANSVEMSLPITDRHGGTGAIGEPLVQDLQPYSSQQTPEIQEAPQTPPAKKQDFQPLTSHPIASSSDEDIAPPPPDFTHRGIHIPTRTSSSSKTTRRSGRFLRAPSNHTPTPSMPTSPESYSRARSSADSVISYETTASSIATSQLPPLQQKTLPDDQDRLSPLLEDDPRSFDLTAPNEFDTGKVGYSLEARSEQLFSREHLQAIFKDTPSLLRFTSFLSMARPKSVPVLIYYLDSLKAIRAINYANAVAEALEPLEGHHFTENPARPTVNAILEEKAKNAFDILVRDDLPAFISHMFIQVVSVSIQKRIIGSLPPLLREASEGLAEVFCLTDPSRADNPIIFASEEFHRTTQYGVGYAIGRNCRFLQGPRTNPHTISRLRDAVKEGKEISEVFLNYRRDGSPFMNLLMMAPLLDSRGILRYFIGAQVDVSGLVKECTELDAFQHMLDKQEGTAPEEDAKDEFQELSEMFNNVELDTVRRFGGSMHREHIEEQDDASMYHRPRLLLKDPSNGDIDRPLPQFPGTTIKPEGRLSGVYKHYVLLRPYPSLRILFTSPSLRVPGVLQSRFLDRIGGSSRVRQSLEEALADGSRGVTAKIRWLSSANPQLNEDRGDEGRPRWIHCTPLLGKSGAVGVWMVVLVDEEKSSGPSRRFRQAPPVPADVRRLRVSSPDHAFFSDEGDEYFPQSVRSGKSSIRNGIARHAAVDVFRRPEASVSLHDLQRAARSGSAEPSINSFALG